MKPSFIDTNVTAEALTKTNSQELQNQNLLQEKKYTFWLELSMWN